MTDIPSADAPLEDRWSVLHAQYEGRPLIARLNKAAARLAGRGTHVFRIGVAVRFNEPDKNGFPSKTDSAALDDIEDALVDALEREGQCVQVLVLTTGGMREFVFYCRDPKPAELALESLHASVESHEVQFMVAEDREWDIYRQFAE